MGAGNKTAKATSRDSSSAHRGHSFNILLFPPPAPRIDCPPWLPSGFKLRVVWQFEPDVAPLSPQSRPPSASGKLHGNPKHHNFVEYREKLMRPRPRRGGARAGPQRAGGWSPRASAILLGRRSFQAAPPRDCALHNRGPERHSGVVQSRPNQSRRELHVPPPPA